MSGVIGRRPRRALSVGVVCVALTPFATPVAARASERQGRRAAPAVTPGGSGGSGSCSIGNTALLTGRYAATATYGGDVDLSASRSVPITFTV